MKYQILTCMSLFLRVAFGEYFFLIVHKKPLSCSFVFNLYHSIGIFNKWIFSYFFPENRFSH